MRLDNRRFIREEAGRCLRCGACKDVCDIAPAIGAAVAADAALSVADAGADERMRWFLQRCSLCGRCRFACERAVDVPALVVAARAVLFEEGSVDTDKYRTMFVDNDWNAISLYRRVYDLEFSSYCFDEAPVAFLPGCSLLNEAPEAALETREWLERTLGCTVSLVDRCCGMPLQEMGLLDRYHEYLDDLFDHLDRMGARKLIVACPNCLGRLARHGSRVGISVQIVYELMAAMGFRAPMIGYKNACIHDSCPARGTEIGTWVREVLADWDIVEMAHHGDCSQCCGSGGAVGMYDSVLADIRAQRRRDEIGETGADVCVTYCMSSCSTLFDEERCPEVRHVLELAFGALADHARFARQVQDMWQGDTGVRCDSLLEGAVRIVGASTAKGEVVGECAK